MKPPRQLTAPFRAPLRRWTPVLFFLAGFGFDTLMLKRIDEPKVIAQQAVYLMLCAVLIAVEHLERHRGQEIEGPRWAHAVWRYRENVLHFMLGTLLNCYTIFYFKSASGMTALAFMLGLAGILVANEFGRFGHRQARVHAALWSLCLISYWTALWPTILGFLGLIPFALAATTAAGLSYGGYRWFSRRHAAGLRPKELAIPLGVPQAAFALLYLAGIIPPVPLSIDYIGIFHQIRKTPSGYELDYSRSWLKFWQNGDQTFSARPGDHIHCFAQIFSPTGFKESLSVRWLYRDPRLGWQSADAIPVQISGGREEGYRAVTEKANYQPGDWRVQVETRDGREIGWIGFRVMADSDTSPRDFKTIVR